MKTDRKIDSLFYKLGWAAIAVVAMIFIACKIYGTGWISSLPGCILHKVTGLYCPGCGGTRATFALLRGRFIRSLIMHPVVPYVAVTGGWFMISQTISRISHWKINIAMRYRDIYIYIALVIVAANCLIKNILLIFFNVAVLG